MQHGGAETPAARGASPQAPDWGAGHYESTAAQILPAARTVVEAAAIGTGERVLDLGCGTGNAALLAAQHTGRVTGVDPAPRLLQVARARAASDGQKVDFLPGDAASLPAGDTSMDVILSVFAVIFAPDPGAAAREMARVLTPGGRIVLSAWIPAGAMFEMTSAAADAVRQAVGAPTPEPLPGMTVTPWRACSSRTASASASASTAWRSADRRRGSSSTRRPRTIRWRSPVCVSSASSAKPRRCVPGCWQSWRTATRTPPASG
jgi:SAM-dependent methyltransferase